MPSSALKLFIVDLGDTNVFKLFKGRSGLKFLKHDFEIAVGLKVPPSWPTFWSGSEAQNMVATPVLPP